MPFYDYECRTHGPFEKLRPLGESAVAQACLVCGEASPRVFLCAPSVLGMDPSRRAAFATNERSAHEPRSSKQHRHGPGCGCSKPGNKTGAVRTADGNKIFPNRRPWMISH